MAKKIDISALTSVVGTMYPPPYDEACLSRERTRLGDAAGLTQFGYAYRPGVGFVIAPKDLAIQ